MKLKEIIGDRQPDVSDWSALADGWSVDSDYTLTELAPDQVECKVCWDHHVCAECLGRYPSVCPNECPQGRCPVCCERITV